MKKALLVSIALVVMYVVGTFAAGTTVNGTRTINGDLTVKGTCTGCGGGGITLVEQHTASNSASLDFTSCISATYDTYKITLTSIIPATNDAKIGFRFNTGSGFDSGSNYSWEAFYLGNAASGPNGSTSDTA